MKSKIYIDDYNYELPQSSIAEFPLKERDSSRLLIYKEGHITDERFINIDQSLPSTSLVILNNTRVINARLVFQKPSGGLIEIFCLEPWQHSVKEALAKEQTVRWNCLIGGASKWKKGQVLKMQLPHNASQILLTASYLSKENDSFIIEFSWDPSNIPFSEIIHRAGSIPLPPYIKRKPIDEDAKTYQTVFSTEEGSVAAPTAALHFTDRVFNKLRNKNIRTEYITLHVGAGTFKPVKTPTIDEHQMHVEPFFISQILLTEILKPVTVIATGTTSLRAIESTYWLGVKLLTSELNNEWILNQWEAYELKEKYPSITLTESINAILKWMEEKGLKTIHCQTSLIIVPGYQFKVVQGLITNFHQPKSTLLLLVSAFIGSDWKKVYEYAIKNNYRFLSYGDSNLLWRKN